MDEKGKGEYIPELAARPKLYPDLGFVFEAFLIIKDYCDDRTIKVQDILNYCELLYISDWYDRMQLLKYVKMLERKVMEHIKANRQNASNIPKRR